MLFLNTIAPAIIAIITATAITTKISLFFFLAGALYSLPSAKFLLILFLELLFFIGFFLFDTFFQHHLSFQDLSHLYYLLLF